MLSVCGSARAADAELLTRLEDSRVAFERLMASSDSSIPEDMLRDCEAVLIFPKTLNLAWGIGGQYGKGVAFRYDRAERRWSPPMFYLIGGLSLGPQIGGQAVDIVLVVTKPEGLESLLKSRCSLGADAGVAVGPAGRNATASTDLGLRAEMYSYARAKGLFIGLSLKGAFLTPDKDANTRYYGRPVTGREVLLQGKGPRKAADAPLRKMLSRYTDKGPDPRWIAAAGLALLAAAAAVFAGRRSARGR